MLPQSHLNLTNVEFDALISKTLDGMVIGWSAGAEKLFGYSAKEMIGQSILRIFPLDRLREEDEILGRLKAGECIDQIHTIRLTKDGRGIEVSLTLIPVKNFAGQIVGGLKIVRDITDRQGTEKSRGTEGNTLIFRELETGNHGRFRTATASFPLRLRQETSTRHQALEAALDLMNDGLTLETYRRLLVQFYGYYRPLEERLRALGGWAERGLNLDARLKTVWLAADLRDLNIDPPRLPVCDDLPNLRCISRGLGCLYVLEGSTLGAQYLSRHIRKTLGFTSEYGGRFFAGYGARTGAMWKVFQTALIAYTTTPAVERDVVQAATDTFDTLHRWLMEGNG